MHYHESQDVVQAFPYFYTPANANVPTVNAGQDSFAINYGVGGHRRGDPGQPTRRRPGADCADCKFEEFFLSSWAVGDPAWSSTSRRTRRSRSAAQLEQIRLQGPAGAAMHAE